MNKVEDFPENWWKQPQVASTLLKQFTQHVVALQVSFAQAGEPQLRVYSGFVITISGQHFWITAGHVIEALEKIQEDESVSDLSLAWHDFCQIPDARIIQIPSNSLIKWKINNEQIDA